MMRRVASLWILFGCLLSPALAQPPDDTAGQEKPEPSQKESSAGEEKAAQNNGEKPHQVAAERLHIDRQVSGTFVSQSNAELILRPVAWPSLVVKKVVPHGTRVQQGQAVLWLDTDKIDQQIREQEYAVQSGRHALEMAELDLRLAAETLELDMEAAARATESADHDLDYFVEKERPMSEQSAEFSLKSARHQLEYSEEELRQLKKMYEADDLTEESEEIILKRAEHDVEYSKYSLERVEESTKRTLTYTLPQRLEQLTEAARRQQLNYEKAKVALPSALAQKKLQREKLVHDQQQAEQRLLDLQADREAMTLQAPQDGIVYYGSFDGQQWSNAAVAGRLKPGGQLGPNEIVITIVDPRQMTVHAELPEKDLSLLRINTPATVVPTADPQSKLTGRIVQISAVPIKPGAFGCEVTVDFAAEHTLMPGMTCQVTLQAYNKPNALVVPAKYVHEDHAGDPYVLVKDEDGDIRQRAVKTGQKTNGKVEIVDGLKDGESIVVERATNAEQ